jgi:hypothetical protein
LWPQQGLTKDLSLTLWNRGMAGRKRNLGWVFN